MRRAGVARLPTAQCWRCAIPLPFSATRVIKTRARRSCRTRQLIQPLLQSDSATAARPVAGTRAALRHRPIALRSKTGAIAVAEANDVATLRCESLLRRQREPWVVARDDAMLEQLFDSLHKIVSNEGVDHVVDCVGDNGTDEIGIRLYLFRHHRNLPHPKPTQRIVDLHSTAIGQIEWIGHPREVTPFHGQWGLFQARHPS